MAHDISLQVNGTPHRVRVGATATLVDVLRDQLGYTGTNKDCTMGICGVCTVLLDGRPVSSCLLLAVQAEGHAITTVEGIAAEDRLDPVQEAFVRHGAVQCGYCTPGFVVTAKALLDQHPRPSREEVLDALEGNVCRCTGYAKILEAVLAASRTGA